MSSATLDMLHRAYAGPFAPKRMAQDSGGSHRSAEKWWARLATPRADVLLRMAQANERLRAELLQRLGDHGYGQVAAENRGVPAASGGGVAGEVRGLDRSASAAGEADAIRVTE